MGLMGVASVVGLLLPATDEGSSTAVAAGFALGVAFLLVSRRFLRDRDVHVGRLEGAGVRRSVLVFSVLLVHSLPEGFAIGSAYASETAGLGVFVILAIALQNIPEGTSVAIPMDAAGFGKSQQFWAAVGTSLPQPVGRRLRLPSRRPDRAPAAHIVRFRGRRDARPGRRRAGAPGVHACNLAKRHCRLSRWRDAYVGAGRRAWRVRLVRGSTVMRAVLPSVGSSSRPTSAPAASRARPVSSFRSPLPIRSTRRGGSGEPGAWLFPSASAEAPSLWCVASSSLGPLPTNGKATLASRRAAGTV